MVQEEEYIQEGIRESKDIGEEQKLKLKNGRKNNF
jgi:hypothetical protein